MSGWLIILLCPRCEEEKRKKANFCKFCGDSLQGNTENITTDVYICKNCGEELALNQQYCPNCGMKNENVSIYRRPNYHNNNTQEDSGSAQRLANTCATGCGFPVGVFLAFIGLFFLIVSIWGLINGMNLGSFLIGFIIGIVLFGWGAAIVKSVGFKIKI